MVTPAKAAYSALPGLFLWRCVLVRSCFFTRDTSCDTKLWKGAALKAVPSKLPNSPETQNTTLERMVFCVTKGDFTVLGMLSIAHSVLHRNRKTVPMLWQESADYITRTTNPYPLSQYSCHSSCLAVLFQTPWSYIVITTFYRKPLVAQ